MSHLRVEAYINTGKGSEGLTPSVFSEVIAASINDKKAGRNYRCKRLW